MREILPSAFLAIAFPFADLSGTLRVRGNWYSASVEYFKNFIRVIRTSLMSQSSHSSLILKFVIVIHVVHLTKFFI